MKIEVDSRIKDYCISMKLGYLKPVNKFMDIKDICDVVFNKRFENSIWTIPIILPVKQKIKEKQVELYCEKKKIGFLAKAKTEEISKHDFYCYFRCIYKADENHPMWLYYKKYIQNDKIFILSGIFGWDGYYKNESFKHVDIIKEDLKNKKWVAFQTRNPLHRAHEYLIRTAIEVFDGVVISPLLGETKKDDIPASIRMKCYKKLVDNYFPKGRVKILPVPIPMHYGGAMEAIFHMKVRENMGCSYMIIGRDHAGVGNYYDTYEAQRIAEIVSPTMKIKPLCFENAFYCHKCKTIVTEKSCPHSKEDRAFLSGTLLRKYLSEGKRPPEYLIRPEVYEILLEWKRSKSNEKQTK